MDECEKRLASAIYAHVNMFLSGIISAVGEDMIGPILRLGLEKQFPTLVKLLGIEFPKTIEEAEQVINKFGHDCRLRRVEPKDDDVVSMYDIVAVYEDEQLDESYIKRAKENFGAFTNVSECIPLLLSRAVNSEEYDFVIRTYKDEHNMIRIRAYIIRKH